jgi:hypothetical protein
VRNSSGREKRPSWLAKVIAASEAAVSATPKFAAGERTHAATSGVTSIST